MENLLQLYPAFKEDILLKGLYLQEEDLLKEGSTIIYTNFITSLDGRIAVQNDGRLGVPDKITNPRDWRLFQELAAQAEVVLTSGRYLRDYADGNAQEILQVHEEPEFTDLVDWRKRRGLAPFPDLAVISSSLDFAIPGALLEDGRRVIVVTTKDADPNRVRSLESKLGSVIISGEHSVEGRALKDALAGEGYRSVYSAAGPRILHLLLEGGVLDHLYLTIASRVLGGNPFASLVEGPLLSPPADFELKKLYYDPFGLDGVGQLFVQYHKAI
jgi:riboflavin biosynthesis pyrimidine reductase